MDALEDKLFLNADATFFSGGDIVGGIATVGTGVGQALIAKGIAANNTAAQERIAQQQLDLQAKVSKQQLDNELLLGKEAARNQASTSYMQTLLQSQTDKSVRTDEAAAKKQFYIFLAVGIGSALVLGVVLFVTKKKVVAAT